MTLLRAVLARPSEGLTLHPLVLRALNVLAITVGVSLVFFLFTYRGG